jgi:hypothetical protein
MNDIMRAAFADELTKIAGLKTQLQGAVNAGWHGHNAQGVPVDGAGWRFSEKGWGRKLPLGGKSMTLATTALQLPGALGREDPTGRGHSRAERVTGLAGNTLGGMAATGALMRTALGAKHPIIASMVGGIGGGLMGERLATTPWALARRGFRRHPAPQMLSKDDAGWRNTAPGGLNTTPDATVGQAQAM